VSKKSKLQCVLDGLTIFARHGGTDVNAVYDQFFAGPGDDAELTAEELAALEADGWFEDEDGWAVFT
jgi:hypothetical protein